MQLILWNGKPLFIFGMENSFFGMEKKTTLISTPVERQ
jgi:hypothetical protein